MSLRYFKDSICEAPHSLNFHTIWRLAVSFVLQPPYLHSIGVCDGLRVSLDSDKKEQDSAPSLKQFPVVQLMASCFTGPHYHH